MQIDIVELNFAANELAIEPGEMSLLIARLGFVPVGRINSEVFIGRDCFDEIRTHLERQRRNTEYMQRRNGPIVATIPTIIHNDHYPEI